MEKMLQETTDYLAAHVPVLASFALKVVLCLAAYFIGKRVIAWVVRTARRMLERSRVQAGAVTFTVSMLKILLYLVLLLGIAMQFGLQESSVAALVASGGVAIGLALQGGLSNFAGGFLLLLFQPFQVGDYIITQGEEGTVRKIEILYTTLETADNRRVIMPNGNLANNVIVNVTAADKRRLELKVGISYQDDIRQAKDVLERLIAEEPEVLKEEGHNVFVAELGESSVVMGMRCWVRTEQYYPVLWRFNEKIKEEFEAAGLQIPYPQMEVHLKQGGPCS